jgi:hypothetical protein
METHMLSDEERYLFDLQGFCVVPDAVDGRTIEAVNAIIDEQLASTNPDSPFVLLGEHKGGEVLRWGPSLLALMDNPRITPYLEELVDPAFRLDHEYVQVLRPRPHDPANAPPSVLLHGGGAPFDPSQYYRFSDGRMWNGLTVVAYYLRDVHPGDGGFACVPGSHKANYPLPPSFETVLEGPLPRWVTAVPGAAGTAVIFTEALTHGTLPWRGAGERRTLFYKYAPHAVAWSWSSYDMAGFDGLTARQRKILERPYSR